MNPIRRARALLALGAALALAPVLPVAGAQARPAEPKAGHEQKRAGLSFDAWWLAAGGTICLGGAMVVVRRRPRRLHDRIADPA
jgi:hypothetical protein